MKNQRDSHLSLWNLPQILNYKVTKYFSSFPPPPSSVLPSLCLINKDNHYKVASFILLKNASVQEDQSYTLSKAEEIQ